jgi:hypothetical protein
VLEVEPAQEIAIGFNAIGIVNVGRLQEAEPIAFRGLDHVLQTARRKRVRAGEADILDAGLIAFGYFEHQIDAVVRQFDDLGLDAHVEPSAAVIDFDDALHVGLHGRLGQRPARFRLHFDLKLVVLGLLVAFEGNAVDHGIFDHGDHHAAAGIVNTDVGKQACGVKRLKSFVDFLGAKPATGAGPEIRANGFRFDAPVAFDNDGISRLRNSDARGRNRHTYGTEKDTAEDNTAKG